MKQRLGKWAKFTVRWGIAIVGVWLVVRQISFHDRIMILDSLTNRPMEVPIVDGTPENAPFFVASLGRYPIERNRVWTVPDRASVRIAGPNDAPENASLLAIHPVPDQQPGRPPTELLIADPRTGQARIISPSQVIDGYTVRALHPLIDVGLITLVRQARLWLLLGALVLLPISYVITARRWHLLLEALQIHMGQGRAFVLNMVGAFYNSFMPGSTGGDLIKAYYAAKHTTHRTRAVLSVIVDRILGLVALIILGGVMAATQWSIPICRKVAILSAALLLLTSAGLFVFYHRNLRRKSGLEWLLAHLPMQRQVHKAVEAMEMYGQRPWMMVIAVVMTFPVHMTAILSATLAGMAFGLKLSALYYWAVVPVIVLVGAIPISPQGAGVMEAMAVVLTRRQGVTVSQAFALVMAIRFCQIFWNLTGAFFVLRGGYHAPTETEAQSLEQDEPEPATSAPVAPSIRAISAPGAV